MLHASSHFSRRTLLTGAAALTASAATKRKNKMRFGFTTYLWGKAWDIPTLITNCTELKAFGIEMRVEMKSAHGVELEIDAARRREIKKQVSSSPVKVIGLATGERFDFLDPEKLKTSIEKAKRYAELSHDIGGRGIRVFPNDFHKEVPQEKTIEQIARSLNELAKAAAGHGQLLRLENHGSAGRLTTLKLILDQVPAKNVVVKLNSDAKDAVNGTFEANFNLVKHRLGDTLHFHNLAATDFPNQLQADLLMDAGWDGWWLPEMDGNSPDPLAGLKQQRALWDKIIETSIQRA
jgi:hypothetical protein